jgi:hypothetical protein
VPGPARWGTLSRAPSLTPERNWVQGAVVSWQVEDQYGAYSGLIQHESDDEWLATGNPSRRIGAFTILIRPY